MAEAFLRTGEDRYSIAAVRAYSYYYREFANNGYGTSGALDTCCIDKESVIPLLKGGLLMYRATGFDKYLEMAEEAAWYLSAWQWHQTVKYLADTVLGKMGYDTFGGTAVSTSHHHLDPFALCYVPDLLELSERTGRGGMEAESPCHMEKRGSGDFRWDNAADAGRTQAGGKL